MPQPDPLRIDIVSDVMCPWCIIGFLQLRAACNATGTRADVVWHPFELNPDMPPEGQDMAEHLAQKYGTTPAQSVETRDRLTELGRDLGFTFNFGDAMRMRNTFRAHQLIRAAAAPGLSHPLKLALFTAHFTDNRDVDDIGVLADIAAEIGMERDTAHRALRDATHADEVRDEMRFWTAKGITGVPAMIFEQQFLVTGAQGVPTYSGILQRIEATRAA